jgi:hypothetical protein
VEVTGERRRGGFGLDSVHFHELLRSEGEVESGEELEGVDCSMAKLQ